MEESFRRAMVLSNGDMTVFETRPIGAGPLAVAALTLLALVSPMLRRRRQEAFRE